MKNIRWELEQVTAALNTDHNLFREVARGVREALTLSDSNLREFCWINHRDQALGFLYYEGRS